MPCAVLLGSLFATALLSVPWRIREHVCRTAPSYSHAAAIVQSLLRPDQNTEVPTKREQSSRWRKWSSGFCVPKTPKPLGKTRPQATRQPRLAQLDGSRIDELYDRCWKPKARTWVSPYATYFWSPHKDRLPPTFGGPSRREVTDGRNRNVARPQRCLLRRGQCKIVGPMGPRRPPTSALEDALASSVVRAFRARQG